MRWRISAGARSLARWHSGRDLIMSNSPKGPNQVVPRGLSVVRLLWRRFLRDHRRSGWQYCLEWPHAVSGSPQWGDPINRPGDNAPCCCLGRAARSRSTRPQGDVESGDPSPQNRRARAQSNFATIVRGSRNYAQEGDVRLLGQHASSCHRQHMRNPSGSYHRVRPMSTPTYSTHQHATRRRNHSNTSPRTGV
jgi:hypothetical protein